MTIELVAIINSYNRLSLLKQALPALVSALRQVAFKAAVVVFDAGSKDGTVEWLRDFSKEESEIVIELLQPALGQDSSFSAGVNSACAYAITRYPELKWFLLYETDNWLAGPQPLNLATKLLADRSELAAAGFTITRKSGEAIGFGCSLPTVVEFLAGQQLTYLLKLDRPRLRDGGRVDDCRWSLCEVVFTSPLLVKRKAWEESGGMDAAIFPFSDCDTDWCWRLAKSGWGIAVISVPGVVHDNEGELSGWSDKRVVDFHRARLRLLSRHVGRWVSLVKPLLLLRHFAELTLLSVLPRAPIHKKESIDKRLRLIKSVMNDYEVEPE
jgi:GT2 family glycosyltransferase